MSFPAVALTRKLDAESIGVWTSLLVISLAAAIGLSVALSGASLAAVAVTAAISLVVVIAAAPVTGAFLWLFVGPLIVGVARGPGLMGLRPNEALLLVAAAGIGLRIIWQMARGERFMPRIGAIDISIVMLVITGSILPLVFRYGRGMDVSTDDFLYALVFIKYLILYALFRLAVTTPRQVETCLKIALISGVSVAIIALLQVKGLFGVPDLLHRYYDSPFEGLVGPSTQRGTSTIASSFGLADMMAMCLAITMAWLSLRGRHYPVLWLAGAMLLAGCIAAGSFSGIIGLGVVVFAVGHVTRRLLAQLALLVPAAALSLAVFWQVIAARLAGFDRYQGLPRSWIGRLENLERFFWPEVFSGFNWLLGVRPAARVAAPETWRNWVYIESGHTWLLWTGGVPLLIAFLCFSWIVCRDLRSVALADLGPVGVAAAAGFASAVMIFVLMLFDPHLTVRGSADLFFPLLALSLVVHRTDGLDSWRACDEPVRGLRC
jgi:hypothetical protein